MKKPKQEIKFVCSDCGKEAEKDKKQSNENWNVFPNVPCKYCGGKMKLDIFNTKLS